MSQQIIIAVLSLLGTLIGTFAGILTSTNLIKYRIEQLEAKVEKHNSVVERMALAENNIKNIYHTLDDLHNTHN
jgi:hypothetical protein